ncbi:MAG: nitroreductase [Candidatus Sumerlaeia bacterium]|nr:nitroreductase [Candidatus Sumerlaeia bacterium]
MDVREAILSRRTHKHWTGEPVPRVVLEDLLELARWAPNHRLTNPWRFAVMPAEALARYGEHVRQNLAAYAGTKPGAAEAIREKLEKMLPKLGAVIIVGCQVDPDPKIHAEDRDACAAACQNILLGATARGLASFWSTGALLTSPPAKAFYGFGDNVVLVGAICLGTAADTPQSKREPLEGKVRWL